MNNAQRPVVSLIIPNYNNAVTLKRCLDSVVSFANNRIEVVLVDDGSSDASQGIMREYSSSYEYISAVFQNNEGVSSARNAGIKKANGKYICFIDSDDVLTEDWFEIIKTKLISASEDVIFTRYLINDGDSMVSLSENLFSTSRPHKSEVILKYAMTTQLNSPWAKFYHTSLFNNNSTIVFPSDMKLGEDAYFVGRCIDAAQSFMYIDMPSMVYFLNPNGSSGKLGTRVGDKIRVFRVKEELLQKYSLLDSVSTKFYTLGTTDYISMYRYIARYQTFKVYSQLLSDYPLNYVQYDRVKISPYHSFLVKSMQFQHIRIVTYIIQRVEMSMRNLIYSGKGIL